MSPLKSKKKLLFALGVVVAAYLVVETIVSVYGWFNWWGNSILILEDTKRTVQFDPVLGYRVNSIPARSARITNGQIEYVGILRGNAQGFAGWQDTGPKRQEPFIRRIAVFGDSFTDGHFLGRSWPERAQDLTRERGQPVQFLNFAQTGAGLANWSSILTKVVKAKDYEIDGIIFSVWESDLRRPFTMWTMPESRGTCPRMLFGRSTGWDPNTYPTSLAEATPYLKDEDRYLLPSEEFEQTLQGKWPSSIPRNFQLVLAARVWHFLQTRIGRGASPPPRSADEGYDRLVDDIRRYVEAKHLPVLVVHLPTRENLLAGTGSSNNDFHDTKAFAKALGAQFLDGSDLFAGMNRREIRANFLPYDGHWNQVGSDRFAELIVEHLNVFGVSAK
jgi:hypothetical protein